MSQFTSRGALNKIDVHALTERAEGEVIGQLIDGSSPTLKRAAALEKEFSSPKVCRTDIKETSPHLISPVTTIKNSELPFNSAEMPPPRLPTPRRRVRATSTSVSPMCEVKAPSPPGLGSIVPSSMAKIREGLKVDRDLSPKSGRVTKLATRRWPIRSSNVSHGTNLFTIFEDGNTQTHDLGVPAALISLLRKPIKCTAADLCSDRDEESDSPKGKENSLRSKVRALSLETSPRKDVKRSQPLSDANAQPKRIKSNDTMMGLGPRPLFRPSSLTSIDEKGMELKGDTKGQVVPMVVETEAELKRKQLIRSQSESAIKQAVARADDDPMLIGDGSRHYILPVIDDGKLMDLKQISGHTLTALIDGKYKDSIHEYFIIDCRYPYEYHGGHIKGSHNIHTQKQLFEMFLEHRTKLTAASRKRVLIIFHCEFSSQRGPGMCRFMRGADRSINGESFPNLHYPELYVLQGGYKSFYESHVEYCVPCLYTPMDDPGHADELKLYRSKSKQELYKANSSSQMKVRQPCRKFVLN